MAKIFGNPAAQRSFVVALLLGAVLGLPKQLPAQFKYTPEDPEVEQMVRRGISFIEQSLNREIGPVCLHALAVCEAEKRYRQRIPVEHQMVSSGVAAADVFTLGTNGEAFDNNTMYEPCLASIFLGVVDKERYEPNIRAVLRLIERRQMDQGAWHYKGEGGTQNRGDTSQTQYCALAIWAAANAGIHGNQEVNRRALDWLLQTQKGSGGWVYRAVLGQQNDGEETLSIATAGAGGVYMLLDAMGANNAFGPKRGKRAGADLPAFVTEYNPEFEKQNEEAPQNNVQVNVAAVSKTTSSANQFIGNKFVPNPAEWTYYYLYSFERYAYFREQAEGQVFEVPDWYDQGVEYLKSTQQGDGSWKSTAVGEQALIPSINTAFAVLFLVRSTELLAGDKAKGTATGGVALPVGNVNLINGKIQGEVIAHDVDDFLDQIEKGEMDLEKYRDSLTQILLPADPSQREQKSRILRNLVTDEDAYKRLVAVKALSSVRDLNNAPALILAMKDPEDEIKVMAHIGLRFISRKMDSIELPTEPSEGDFLTARKQWIDWYKSIRPDDRQVTE